VKILNLFAGIGGNRTLWGDKHEITAVEWNQQIAMIYHKRFPKDIIIIGDAYDFLEKNYKEYDFCWCGPDCITHSQMNMFPNSPPRYPDLRLYELIIFLRKWFEGDWIVENVIPYYKPLIIPTATVDRHYIWSNKKIENKNFIRTEFIKFKDDLKGIAEEFKVDIEIIPTKLRRKILRNMVRPEAGLYIFNQITNNIQLTKWL